MGTVTIDELPAKFGKDPRLQSRSHLGHQPDVEMQIVQGDQPQPEDLLIRDLGLSPAAVAPVLLALEMEGQVQRQPGGLLSRCPT